MEENIEQIGLYIHIPFCKAKCNYCDFNSYAGAEKYIAQYFDALKREMLLYSEKLKDYKIRTVFIGGGTPSLVDTRYLYETINSLRQYFNVEKGCETSIETNPGTLSYEKLLSYKALGINRLSIGLQAWQNELLGELGRIHCREEFSENFKLARKAGFKNINVDLIFGIPGQKLGDWAETIANIVKLEPEHVSCYSLKIEEDTVYGRKLEEGLLVSVDDELDRKMYYIAIDKLTGNKYRHYEISNFAKPGYECRHNLVYWKAERYIGLGAGAHSYFEGKRYNNCTHIESYVKSLLSGKIPEEDVQEIDKMEEISEFLILGLRLVEGISAGEFKARFHEDMFDLFGEKIKKLLKKELMEKDGDRIRLTNYGLDTANQVFAEFV